jgi:hypothetical protein
VSELFDTADIPYWLFGGWAVDFHVGSITRPHDDVDMAVWQDDIPRISQQLEAEGWRHTPSDEDDGGTAFERSGVRLELTFLVRDPGARIVTPLRDAPAVWPEETFANDARDLHGVRARVVALGTLASWKSSPRSDPDDAAKDAADSAVLARVPKPRSTS